jgi:hypothetical protein
MHCSCSHFPNHVHPHHGHVATNDISIITHEHLQYFFSLGKNFIPHPSDNLPDAAELSALLTLRLDAYAGAMTS